MATESVGLKEALEFLLKDLKHRHLVRKDGDENTQRDYIKIAESTLNRLEELEKVLSFIKEHVLLDGSILRANFQWDLDIEENGELLKEYLK